MGFIPVPAPAQRGDLARPFHCFHIAKCPSSTGTLRPAREGEEEEGGILHHRSVHNHLGTVLPSHSTAGPWRIRTEDGGGYSQGNGFPGKWGQSLSPPGGHRTTPSSLPLLRREEYLKASVFSPFLLAHLNLGISTSERVGCDTAFPFG